MGLNIGGEVEKINGKEISYKQFVERYLEKNRPVVLTGLMDGWRASKDWVTPDGNPNLSFFSEHFGQSRVQVAECGSREFTDQKRVEMSILEFINHWRAHSAGKLYNNPSHEGEQQLLYLKDWHFVKENPEYVAYETPLFFVDDWLNLYLDYHPMHVDSDVCCEKNEINCSDYRFVYMGAKGGDNTYSNLPGNGTVCPSGQYPGQPKDPDNSYVNSHGHIAGLQMCVARKDGIFYRLHSATSCLTGGPHKRGSDLSDMRNFHVFA